MKKYFHYSLATFLIAFVFVCGCAAQTSSQTANRQLEAWKTFSPAEKNFKVSLPAQPEEMDSAEKQKIVSAIRSQVVKTHAQVEVSFLNNVSVYDLEAQWSGFRILVIDYKWQKIDYDEKSGILVLSSESSTDDLMLREWMEFEKAKMLPSGVFISDMTFVQDGLHYKVRAFATKNRVYMLFVGMPDLNSATPALAKVFQAEVDKFFNSFQILDNKPQIARGTVKSLKATN
ncbi:MAG TPA: hypothetical protein VF644_00375 [Pyrinomonadaceae bacterium]|jgi:hypothetical protein